MSDWKRDILASQIYLQNPAKLTRNMDNDSKHETRQHGLKSSSMILHLAH